MSETRNTRELRRLFDGINQDSTRHARQEERQKRRRIEDELQRNITVRPAKRQTKDEPPYSQDEGGCSITESSEELQCGICFEDTSTTISRDLKCGHKFCYVCIMRWTTGRLANRQRCPRRAPPPACLHWSPAAPPRSSCSWHPRPGQGEEGGQKNQKKQARLQGRNVVNITQRRISNRLLTESIEYNRSNIAVLPVQSVLPVLV
eukprot:COSAG05_NODE_8093_length_736_cov_231.877551_1_plen_204_part_10